jgi:hypothetical protein
MCIIIDKSIIGIFLSNKPEHRVLFNPVGEYLTSNKNDGILIYGEKNGEEILVSPDFISYVGELYSINRAKICPNPKSKEETSKFQKAKKDILKQRDRLGIKLTNDIHVLALAKVSGARTLICNDGLLEDNFTDIRIIPTPKGKLYLGRLGNGKFHHHPNVLDHCKGCPGYKKAKSARKAKGKKK